MLNEFRNDAGQLRAFEVRRGYSSFGVLCAALAKYRGVEFHGLASPYRFPRPARFTFQGHGFQVGIPFVDYWVGPLERGDHHASLLELLVYVKQTVLRHRRPLARTHYVSHT